jgi:glutathione S-transferase
MELFGSYTSPFVRHCRVVLLQLGEPFEFVETDYAASARLSPTKQVPFLRDGDRFLTDSSAILQYLRERAGQRFPPETDDCQRYYLATTALNAAVNVYLLEKDGIVTQQSPYLARQAARVAGLLQILEDDLLPIDVAVKDSVLRVACFLEWALFRKRFSLAKLPRLESFLRRAQSIEHFASTAPPAG